MNMRGAIAALVFLACGSPLTAMADATPAPVTFNVAVKVSNLTADVKDVAVKCSITAHDGSAFATGEGQSLPLTGGAFDGTVTVPVAGSYTVQQATEGGWECDLYLVDTNNDEAKVTMEGGPAWAKPGPGPLPVIAIVGGFVPANETNLDPNTGKKPADAVTTPVTVSTGP